MAAISPRRRRTRATTEDAPTTFEAADPRGIDPAVAIARPDPSKPYPEENPVYTPPGEGEGEGEAPTLEALDPSTAALGDPPFTLTVTGTGFTASSVIVWNGGVENTTFDSDTQLTTGVDMTTAQVAMPIPVLVRTGSQDSNSISFDLTEPVAGGTQSRRHTRSR